MGSRIPWTIFRIPKPRIPYFSWFRNFPYMGDVILNLSKNSYWYKQIRSLLSFVLIASMIKYEFILPCPTLSWTIVVCRIYGCYMAEHLLVLNCVDKPHPEIPGTCLYPHPHRTLIWLVYLSHNLPNTVRKMELICCVGMSLSLMTQKRGTKFVRSYIQTNLHLMTCMALTQVYYFNKT